MKYRKYTINTTTEAEETVCYMLGELGIASVEIDNNVPVPDADRQGGIFEELQPDIPKDDGSSRISFYMSLDEKGNPQLPETSQAETIDELIAKIQEELSDMRAYTDIGEGNIVTEISDESDWRDNWKQYFSSFSIGDIFIKPTWETAPKDLKNQVMVEIDPGVSFGTGKHESTQLVIRQMQRYLEPQQEILDVGCGSGILSIVALKMGARHVTGTDIDEDCIASSYENFRVNHLDEALGSFYVGNLTDNICLQEQIGFQKYDLVLANILADIIIPMAPMLAKTMKPGAKIITSGIIDFKQKEVENALITAGLAIVETNAQGEWRSVTAEKKENRTEK